MDYDRLASLFCVTANRMRSSSSLVCYLYFCQKVGFNLGYCFKSTLRGIKSAKAEEYIDSAVLQDRLVYSRASDMYTYTMTGNQSCVPVAFEDMEVIEKLDSCLADLCSMELSFLVTLDMLNESISGNKTMTVDEQKEYVSTALKRVYIIYTDEVFDNACRRLIEIGKLSVGR